MSGTGLLSFPLTPTTFWLYFTKSWTTAEQHLLNVSVNLSDRQTTLSPLKAM